MSKLSVYKRCQCYPVAALYATPVFERAQVTAVYSHSCAETVVRHSAKILNTLYFLLPPVNQTLAMSRILHIA